jgi:hypothetical protein
MIIRESLEQAERRWRDLALLQDHYTEFDTLLVDVMENFLGFPCSDIQRDIGNYLANGPRYRMIQAQRGQAKTTITAIYAVYRLIHDPSTRVLIVSAGEDMAMEVSTLIIRIIMGMDELECLRPDRSAGDRSSVEAFDVHYTLKGPDKSPSVKCIGITSNSQGKRADLLIADDIESAKNSQTAIQRSRLHHLTLDFSSICTDGDIVWLGTPQSVDSVYNTLPGRGVSIRIWPGRYPTAKEFPDYEGFLAPLLAQRLAKDPSLQTGGGIIGDRGKAIDTLYLTEDKLVKKEIDQGAAYFALQHMLSTKLKDEDRFPLKLSSIRFTGFDVEQMVGPMTLAFVRNDQNLIKLPDGHMIKDRMYRVQEVSDFGSITGWHMYVDPTGGGANGDELAYGITGMLAGRVMLADADGRPGGLGEECTDWLTHVCLKWKPKTISIEKNYGNGALASVWLPKLKSEFDKRGLKHPGIEEVWEAGQKELRIIDVLEPMIGAGKFICYEGLIDQDWSSCQKYPADIRQTYSLIWQLARITRDKGSLIHDDRLDAVAGSARYWVEALSVDDAKAVAAAKDTLYRKLMSNPLGNGRSIPGWQHGPNAAPNALAKHGLHGTGHLELQNKYPALFRR